ncbi:MAG: sigma-54 dependent transcriptional regulator, partial [Nitrospirae bacterium]|nr:sigma-54 dependent transcriptional regulator [Nitrospirota bacterium]
MMRILIVEDKKSMADMLTDFFGSEGFDARAVYTVRDASSTILKDEFNAVITDLMLPDGSGMDVLRLVKTRYPFIPVIVMTAYGSIETAVKAVKEGAYDFITKPFKPEHLALIIRRALDEKGVERGNMALKGTSLLPFKMFNVIGVSEAWKGIMEKVKKIAHLKTTVLILGESGTGKELIARSIHHLGQRAKNSFITINCAAIPKDLMESELFGHEKGAFTGAHETKHGKFELADKGTIFLDEIGDLELSLQAKLLRILQESEFERVGGTKTIRVDVRTIAASNKDLEKAVAEGRFREDLFYRLNVFPIVIPPLR